VQAAAGYGPDEARALTPPPGAAEEPGATAALTELYRPPAIETLSRMRRTIGEHMLRSLRTAATVTQWIEVDFRRSRRGGGRSA